MKKPDPYTKQTLLPLHPEDKKNRFIHQILTK
jgi:hypothetical protein